MSEPEREVTEAVEAAVGRLENEWGIDPGPELPMGTDTLLVCRSWRAQKEEIGRLRRTVRSPEDCVRILNELVTLDMEAAKSLLNARVPCNAALAAHPTIEVGVYEGQTKVGILGVLEGLFRDRENPIFGPIVAVLDGPGDSILSFRLASEDEIEKFAVQQIKEPSDA